MQKCDVVFLHHPEVIILQYIYVTIWTGDRTENETKLTRSVLLEPDPVFLNHGARQNEHIPLLFAAKNTESDDPVIKI